MRCRECNVILNDEEATHKDKYGEYTDTCFQCLYNEFVPDGYEDEGADEVPE